MPSESEYLDYLTKQGLKLNALSLEKTIARVGKHGGFLTTSRKKLLHEVVQGDLQFLYEQTLLADKELFELACQAFHSFVRSYATHSSDTRQIFHVRSLHFGHVAKSFALREPPASAKLRDTGRNAKKGTLQKRKERDDKQQAVIAKKQKKVREEKRRYAQNVSEFAD